MPFGLPNATDRDPLTESNPSEEYNCLAWAVHSTRYYIWPDELEQFSWPPDMDRADTVECVRCFFERVGFEACEDELPQEGWEKIAIYANEEGAQHVARLRHDGRWTSKLGPSVDVAHSLNSLVGPTYGRVVLYMKRIWNGAPPELPPLHPPPPRLINPDGSPLLA